MPDIPFASEQEFFPTPRERKCICDTGPSTEGPLYDCPIHGMPVYFKPVATMTGSLDQCCDDGTLVGDRDAHSWFFHNNRPVANLPHDQDI